MPVPIYLNERKLKCGKLKYTYTGGKGNLFALLLILSGK